MADEKPGLGVSGTSIVSVLVAVMAAGLYGQHLLLRDARPPTQATRADAVGIQQIDARLWEDPLFATRHFLQVEPDPADMPTPPSVEVTLRSTPGERQRLDTHLGPAADEHAPRMATAGRLRTKPETGRQRPGAAATVPHAGDGPPLPARLDVRDVDNSSPSPTTATFDEAKAPRACRPARVPVRGQHDEIVVVLPGGPYEQAAETRRRTRYAVLSALDAEGFEPSDPEHLGCFGYPLPQRATGGSQAGTVALAPFERFVTEHTNSAVRELAVIWLDENTLRDAADGFGELEAVREGYHRATGVGEPAPETPPSVELEAIREGHHRATGVGKPAPENPPLRIIGPYSSSVLARLRAADCPSGRKIPFIFYNYAATVAGPEEDATQRKAEEPVRQGKCDRAKFVQVVATDDRLARSLKVELEGRRLTGARVALVSEFDTVYGRDLSRTVSGTLDARCLTTKPLRGGGKCLVTTLGYLRGLDGSLPRLTSSSDEATAPAPSPGIPAGHAEANPLSLVRTYEGAEGNAQLDYLERLPDPLRQIEQEVHPEFGRFKAIGLLGSDVYDKMLLLRALRPRFPDALFFTTDLDARLVDPGEFATTRGLVVASSFGLRLGECWQGDTPSFRDTYQASAFLATRLAADPAASYAADAAASYAADAENYYLVSGLSEWHADAPLFEIGRWGAVRLAAADGAKSGVVAGCTGRAMLPPVSSGSANRPAYVRTWLQVAGLLGLAAAAWAMVVFEFHLTRRPVSAFLVACALLGALLPIGAAPPAVFIRAFLTSNGRGEPLLLTDGVSIWPVIGIRLLGSAFCVLAIRRVYRKLGANSASIANRFRLISPPPEHPCDSLLRAARAFGGGIADRWGHWRWPLRKPKRAASAMSIPRNQSGPLAAKKGGPSAPGCTSDEAWRWLPRRPQLAIRDLCRRVHGQDGPQGTPDEARATKSIYDRDPSGYGDVQELWTRLGPPSTAPRVFRAGTYTAASVVLFGLMLLVGPPENILARGAFVQASFWIATGCNIFLMQYLVVLVYDATAFSSFFVAMLRPIQSKWPQGTCDYYRERTGLGVERLLSDWIDIKMIAARTECIVELVYFPFVALSVYAVSLSSVFDYVPLSPSLAAPAALGFGLLVYIAARLRNEAEKARDEAIRRVAREILQAKAREADTSHLEQHLSILRDYNVGSFRRWSQQPLLRAILLPVSTLGGSAVLQQLLSP